MINTPEQIEFLRNKNYIKPDQSVEDRVEEMVDVVRRYENDYYVGLADRIEWLIKEKILSPSTPQWANSGIPEREGSNPLPASCYITTPQNSIKDIFYSIGEVAMMSKLGGGVGIDCSDIAEKGTYLSEGFHTNSKLDWIEMMVDTGGKVSQGATRRGYSVPFINIDDTEFNDLMDRVSKKNPNEKDVFVSNNVGIILPRGFRQRLSGGDTEAKKRYIRVLKTRVESGNVYIIDVENMNKNQSPVYEKLGHEVHSSNICVEISTPKYADKSFVCVIASLNLTKWDIIKKDPQIIKDCMMYLDIQVSEFIRLTEGVQFMEKARRSAIEKRDIGLGALGFHEYLQMNDCAFGDLKSRTINKEIFSTIRKYADEYGREIGEKLGSPKMCQEAGLVRRNVSQMIVAPNKSTSFLCGTSLGIEPEKSNYYVKTLAGIKTTVKNKYLEKVLESHGKNDNGVWTSILENLGSAQHLDFLTEEEKLRFRTASEISPKDLIDLAADRQVYIDMAQSFNLFNRPNYTLQDLIKIHKYAFDRGIKTLYYYYSQAHAALETQGEAWDTCAACAD